MSSATLRLEPPNSLRLTKLLERGVHRCQFDLLVAVVDGRIQVVGANAVGADVFSARNEDGGRGHHNIPLEPLLRPHGRLGLGEFGVRVLR